MPRITSPIMQTEEVIDDALELLYGSIEEKHVGINKVLALCRDVSIETLIENHQLMSALTRLFSEDNLPPELTFGIGKLFLTFCMDSEFHDVLSKTYRVGALAVDAIELEVKRAYHRGNDSISTTSLELAPSAPSYLFTKKQERLVMIYCEILSNIADDFWALRKMAKKSLTTTLGRCLEMKTLEALQAVLVLLLKASIFEESADEISNDKHVIEKLVLLLVLSETSEISSIVVRVLFNLSFHHDCFHIISSTELFSAIKTLFGKKSIHSTIIKLTYHLSCNEENRNKLIEAGIATKLSDVFRMLYHHKQTDSSLAGLLVNMSSHPLCAEEFIQNGAVDTILGSIQEFDDEYTQMTLLKILRNISQWSHNLQCNINAAVISGDIRSLDRSVKQVECYFFMDSPKSPEGQKKLHAKYWEHHFWDTHIETILQSALVSKDDDLLVEWIGILSNLTKDDMPAGLQWHDLIYDNSSSILRLCHNILDSSNECLKTEVIAWLGELCTNQECSAWIASSNLVEAIHEELQYSSHDATSEEKKLQILLSYQQFMMYEETRFHVIGGLGKFFLTHNFLQV